MEYILCPVTNLVSNHYVSTAGTGLKTVWSCIQKCRLKPSHLNKDYMTQKQFTSLHESPFKTDWSEEDNLQDSICQTEYFFNAFSGIKGEGSPKSNHTLVYVQELRTWVGNTFRKVLFQLRNWLYYPNNVSFQAYFSKTVCRRSVYVLNWSWLVIHWKHLVDCETKRDEEDPIY